MVKKAVLFGCNYPGQKAELKGCVNDVWTMKKILTEIKGFEEANIKVLIDTDSNYESPTGGNMRKSLKDLVAGATVDDILFVHYSGHGTQVPSFSESDWKNEALCPTDMNLIVDDDLKEIFGKLPKGTKLTVVTDCCHSGGMLDHKEVIIEGDKKNDSASRGVAPDFKNRSLEIEQVVQILSSMFDKKIPVEGVRAALGENFGDQASQFATAFMDKMHVDKETQREAQGFLSKLFSSCFGSKPADGSAASTGGSTGGNAGPAAGGSTAGGSSTGEGASSATGGEKPERPSVDAEIGVLVTGCQSTETSADVRQGGTAFGALSNTIDHCLRAKPNASYRELVMDVRAELAKKGFTQNPCLECSESNADMAFIC